jgi:hypothetical protein
MRSEIVSVEGRSLGKVTSRALLQSTNSVLSFYFIDGFLLPAHGARRDGTNPGSASTFGEGYVQSSILVGSAQRMKSRLPQAVLHVIGQKQRRIEKNLLHFSLGDPVLPFVSFVPVEPGMRHGRPLYMFAIYIEIVLVCKRSSTRITSHYRPVKEWIDSQSL